MRPPTDPTTPHSFTRRILQTDKGATSGCFKGGGRGGGDGGGDSSFLGLEAAFSRRLGAGSDGGRGGDGGR